MALHSAASSVKLFSIAKTAATCGSPASLYAATNSSVQQKRLASGGKYPKCAVQDCQKCNFITHGKNSFVLHTFRIIFR